MKENYVKPMIFCENFMLSQTIARNCGDDHTSTFGESNHYSETACQWKVDETIMIFANNGCNYPTEEMYQGDPDLLELLINSLIEDKGFCYNNPDSGQQLFSST